MKISTSQIFINEDTGEAAFTVHSDRTFYQVAVLRTEVHVIGPGVDETYEREALGLPAFCLDNASLAAFAVMLFENGYTEE